MPADFNIISKSLQPSPIANEEYLQLLDEIKNKINQTTNINEVLNEYGDNPYYFKKDGKLLTDGYVYPSVKDAASFYVLIDYLLTDNRKSFDRLESYRAFFNEENEAITSILFSIAQGRNTKSGKQIKIDFVKGSLYKIKKYFLENNKIKDIRGASAILDYLNTDATFEYLDKNYIRECAIYCGGGNVLIIVPDGEGAKVCEELERLYTEISLTAKNAFVNIKCTIDDVAASYNEVQRQLNEELEERKKLKLYEINPENETSGLEIKGEKYEFKKDKPAKGGQACHLCGVRDAKYIVPSPDGEIDVCPSCLRKTTVGRNKAIFYDEFEKSQNVKMKNRNSINSISDISDLRGYVALIYADGNNLGNIVKNINTPFQHMYFSRKLEHTTKQSVYSAIYEVMVKKHSDPRFEAICLGGDDLMIVVPADVSLDITNKIINSFDSAFNNAITLSAGVCIAKSTTPIQNMFAISQECLKSAKKYERKSKEQNGTLDVVVMEGNSYTDLESRGTTLFPMTNKKAEKIISIIDKMKIDGDISKHQLYRFRYAADNMSENEFQLFYLYQVAKLRSRKYTEYISQLFDIDNSAFSGLVRVNDKLVSPWSDIVLLWDYSGGEKSESGDLSGEHKGADSL